MNLKFFLDEARYYVALGLTFTLPPMLLYWLLIHPLVSFWRRLGVYWAYTLVLLPILSGAGVIIAYRKTLMSVDYGLDPRLAVLGISLLVISIVLGARVRSRLRFSQLVGLPEIDPQTHAGPLVTEGIYACIRHPRYAQLLVALAGYALLANYLAAYLAVLLWFPGVWIIVRFEEKELRQRYGADYEAYARRVPRFLPRLSRKA